MLLLILCKRTMGYHAKALPAPHQMLRRLVFLGKRAATAEFPPIRSNAQIVATVIGAQTERQQLEHLLPGV